MIDGLRRLLGNASLLAALAGCKAARPTVTPMETLHDAASCTSRAPALLVMLPGAYSRPADFRAQGFVSAVRSRGLAADIVIADAHLGYFTDHSVIRRIREDMVLADRQAGHRKIWLIGISLGGLAALGYAARHGEEIDGVVAIAPYPGSREVLREIAASGGPGRWRAQPHGTGDDLEREVWGWLADGMTRPDRAPAVYLGYGRDDRFVEGHRMIAGTLPADRSSPVPGGHDWGPWLAAWEAWLDRGLLPRQCNEQPESHE
ncbi:MAG: alpha/beta fold hydrolase [Sterolibacteriaceae bacterium]|nr:alpha/beta fold hydrolase [Sterolibacteriaceae bacterium]